MKARISNVQTLIGLVGLLLASQSGAVLAHDAEPTTTAQSNPVVPQSCEYALTALVQHSSLPASRREGQTAVLEAQDDEQATIGLFSEANRNIALGWLRIDWAKNRLLDLTNDIEAPSQLRFRPEDWTRVAACLRISPIRPN